MTTPEGQPGKQTEFFAVSVGSIVLDVPNLRPSVQRDSEGKVQLDINLEHKDSELALKQVDEEINKPRLRGFVEGIRNGHKRAAYSVGFGTLSVMVVGAAYFEVVRRHGKDIQRIFNLLEERMGKRQENAE